MWLREHARDEEEAREQADRTKQGNGELLNVHRAALLVSDLLHNLQLLQTHPA